MGKRSVVPTGTILLLESQGHHYEVNHVVVKVLKPFSPSEQFESNFFKINKRFHDEGDDGLGMVSVFAELLQKKKLASIVPTYTFNADLT